MKKLPEYQILNRGTRKYPAVFFMVAGCLFAWVTRMRNPDTVNLYVLMPLWMRILTHFSIFCHDYAAL